MEFGLKPKQTGLYSNYKPNDCVFALLEPDNTHINCPCRYFQMRIKDRGDYRQINGRLCFSQKIIGMIRFLLIELIFLISDPTVLMHLRNHVRAFALAFSFWLFLGVLGCFVHRRLEKKMVAQIDLLFMEIQIPDNGNGGKNEDQTSKGMG